MNPSCPDCNTELTPSIVGYLCHDCGSVHSFEKISSTRPSSGNTPAKPIVKKSSSNQKSRQNEKNVISTESPSKATHIKNKVKNFVMPVITELPKPIDESHLINDHYPSNTTATQAPLGAPTAITAPPLAAAVQQNEIASEQQNKSFAQYMRQQDIENGQLNSSVSSLPQKNYIPIIIAIVVITAGVSLVLAIAYQL